MADVRALLLDAMQILDPPGNLIGAVASIELRQKIERLAPAKEDHESS